MTVKEFVENLETLNDEQRADLMKQEKLVQLLMGLGLNVRTDYFNNVHWQFKSDTNNIILGVYDDELYTLDCVSSGIANNPIIHLHSFRKLTESYLEDMFDEDYIRDLWKDMVASDNTELGLSDYADELREEYENADPKCDDMYYYDDCSYRASTVENLENLSQEDLAEIEEEFGVFGEDYVTIMIQSSLHLDKEFLDSLPCDENGVPVFSVTVNEDLWYALVDWVRSSEED